MRVEVNGFEVEVTVREMVAHLRVTNARGRVVVDTDALSIAGMENMAAVFEFAARETHKQLEGYAARESARLAAARRRDQPLQGPAIASRDV